MCAERATTLSSGVWQLRSILSSAADVELRRWPWVRGAQDYDAVLGWGHKLTAAKARKLAREQGKPYIAMEDGWIRSIEPGGSEPMRSFVLDRSGIYYDARQTSDLEQLIEASAKNTDRLRLRRADRGMERLRTSGVSKYNNGAWLNERRLGLDAGASRRRILVLDQTHGDASVSCGLADAASFSRMLDAARNENPGAEIVVKLHPEVVSGRKRGYLSELDLRDVRVIATAVNPWALLDIVDHVYVVSSQMGFEAMMAGIRVTCFGAPFYAGWGLTDDRIQIERRKVRPTLHQLFAAAYFDYAVYVDPRSKRQVSFEDAVGQLEVDREAARERPNSGDAAAVLVPAFV